MPKTRAQKEVILEGVKERVTASRGVVFASYSGLSVKESQELRKKLRENEAGVMMAKKTLLRKALAEGKIEYSEDALAGPVALVYGSDEVIPAKVLADFLKTHKEQVKILGGLLEGKFIPSERVATLAKLPTKTALYAKLVGSIHAPVSGFVNVLAGNLRGLVTVLKAVGEKKSPA